MAALRNRFVSYRASTFGPGIQLCSPACSSSCCDDAAARSFRRLKPVHRMLDGVAGHRWNNASLKRPLSLAHFMSKESSASSPFPSAPPFYVVVTLLNSMLFTYFLRFTRVGSLLIPISVINNCDKFFVDNFEMYYYFFKFMFKQ